MPPRFELRAGAEITFGGAPDGRIIDVDPPELFAFSWGTDHLRREIRPDDAGSVAGARVSPASSRPRPSTRADQPLAKLAAP